MQQYIMGFWSFLKKMIKSEIEFCPVDDRYRYLCKKNMPMQVHEFLNLYGVKEVSGDGNNDVILNWADEIKNYVGIDYNADSIPWCGLALGVVMKRSGYKPPRICVRAKEWFNFGLQRDIAGLGDVLIFDRKGGGHVGLYVGEDKGHYFVLGANQNDSVNIKRMQKKRCIGIRSPYYVRRPFSAKPVFLEYSEKVSYNES